MCAEIVHSFIYPSIFETHRLPLGRYFAGRKTIVILPGSHFNYHREFGNFVDSELVFT